MDNVGAGQLQRRDYITLLSKSLTTLTSCEQRLANLQSQFNAEANSHA